ncbi:N-acetyltransferase [Solwaraspora sp. WMMA2065]|uniref:GNAT family N-acetyltransferase n=1 Tax=Solwaraspora sp. WMMA2065 TaxID=3015166 RepID=UPI00259BCA54|nr:N-acetyltransferase [Solwaraspora sp. WMMA2065]WJK37468.1 N-acetyltransferase [Solwaraspora sp. WMMA2065]
MAAVLVRRERAGDVAAVREVVAAAFSRPPAAHRPEPTDRPGTVTETPAEVGLLDELRADPAWIPALSLVAVAVDAGAGRGQDGHLPGLDATGEVVGHVVCTRGQLDSRPVLGLGPLAVRPNRQRAGVGSALMHAVLAAAEARDETLVALLGEPAYYRRFGLRPASEFGIVAPDPRWGPYFQARPLGGATPTPGRFRYAEPFERL